MAPTTKCRWTSTESCWFVLPSHSAPIPSGRQKDRSKELSAVVQDSVYIYNKFSPISYDLWCYIRKIVDFVADNWHLKDHGTHAALETS